MRQQVKEAGLQVAATASAASVPITSEEVDYGADEDDDEEGLLGGSYKGSFQGFLGLLGGFHKGSLQGFLDLLGGFYKGSFRGFSGAPRRVGFLDLLCRASGPDGVWKVPKPR